MDRTPTKNTVFLDNQKYESIGSFRHLVTSSVKRELDRYEAQIALPFQVNWRGLGAAICSAESTLICSKI